MRINPYGYLDTTFLNQQILNHTTTAEPRLTRERIEILFYDLKAELQQHYTHLGLSIDILA
jgi:hypothetical protein